MDRGRVALVAGEKIPVFKIKTDRLTLGLGCTSVGKDNPRPGEDRFKWSAFRKTVLLDSRKGPNQHSPAIFGEIGRRNQATDIHARNPHESLDRSSRNTAREAVYNCRARHLGDDIDHPGERMNDQGLVVGSSQRVAEANSLRSLCNQSLPQVSGNQPWLGKSPDHQLGAVECVVTGICNEEIGTIRIRTRTGGDVLVIDIAGAGQLDLGHQPAILANCEQASGILGIVVDPEIVRAPGDGDHPGDLIDPRITNCTDAYRPCVFLGPYSLLLPGCHACRQQAGNTNDTADPPPTGSWQHLNPSLTPKYGGVFRQGHLISPSVFKGS